METGNPRFPNCSDNESWGRVHGKKRHLALSSLLILFPNKAGKFLESVFYVRVCVLTNFDQSEDKIKYIPHKWGQIHVPTFPWKCLIPRIPPCTRLCVCVCVCVCVCACVWMNEWVCWEE